MRSSYLLLALLAGCTQGTGDSADPSEAVAPEAAKPLTCPFLIPSGEFTTIGTDFGQMLNEVFIEFGVDAVLLLAISHQGVGEHPNEHVGLSSVTGGYGTFMAQPSTLSAYWSKDPKDGVPLACRQRRTDLSKPWQLVGADGYCRHKPSANEIDPTCGQIAEGRSVVESHAAACMAFINTPRGLRQYVEAVARVLVDMRSRKGRDWHGAVLRYSGGSDRYAAMVADRYRELCDAFGPSR